MSSTGLPDAPKARARVVDGRLGRVLFLVDRNNLADQTLGEFRNLVTLDDGRRFSEIYPHRRCGRPVERRHP